MIFKMDYNYLHDCLYCYLFKRLITDGTDEYMCMSCLGKWFNQVNNDYLNNNVLELINCKPFHWEDCVICCNNIPCFRVCYCRHCYNILCLL